MNHTHFEVRYTTNPLDFKNYDTQRIRQDFLIQNLMEPNKINLVYSHYDRYIAGGVIPQNGPLGLETIDPLKADYFLERRVINAEDNP